MVPPWVLKGRHCVLYMIHCIYQTSSSHSFVHLACQTTVVFLSSYFTYSSPVSDYTVTLTRCDLYWNEDRDLPWKTKDNLNLLIRTKLIKIPPPPNTQPNLHLPLNFHCKPHPLPLVLCNMFFCYIQPCSPFRTCQIVTNHMCIAHAVFLEFFKVKVKVTQSCLILCNPMDYRIL